MLKCVIVAVRLSAYFKLLQGWKLPLYKYREAQWLILHIIQSGKQPLAK